MIYPLLGEFKSLQKKYKVVGVSMEISGDTETPITLFRRLKGQGKSYLLESVEGGENRGRYSFIGRNPFMTMEAYGKEIYTKKGDKTEKDQGDPLEYTKRIMESYKSPYLERLPDFTGGAVGYIGYDTIRNYTDLPNINEDYINIPDLHLLLTKEVIVYDHVKQKIVIIVNACSEKNIEKNYKKTIDRLEEIKAEILNTETSIKEDKLRVSATKYSSNETRESFISKVEKAKAYIEKDEVFQVVLSQRLELETGLEPLEVYRNLRAINPSPYLFYIDFEDYQVIGASPELMVKVKDNEVKTCPIAGTRPRGKTLKEDKKLMKELLNDKKEVSEHLMLVDLAKEDIEKTSKPGTVKVRQYMDICKCSHVMHIISTVIGELKDDYDIYDVLKNSLPAGTLSGFPKIRAMEIIDQLENKKRGIYGGTVGYFGFNGNMDTCIAIRFILFKDNKAYLQSGAGIVAESNPHKEYEETQRKLEALLETIKVSEN